MDQSCYKCGQLVAEGRPFCPHCFAPQIRVLVTEPAETAVLADARRTGATALSASETVPVLAVPASWPEALKACALAAGVASVLMFVGLNLLFAMFSVGFLSVVFYRQRQPAISLRAALGFRLGALGGVLCSGMIALLLAFAAMVPELRARLHQQILENAEKWVGSHPADPQFQAALDQLKTPEGFATAMIVAGILLLLVSIALGCLGGGLGAAILGRRQRS